MAKGRQVRVVSALAVGVLLLATPLSGQAGGGSPEKAAPFVVSAAWLAEHLADPWLVILHVGTKDTYDAGHIPGARFLPIEAVSTPRGGGLTLELPPVPDLRATFEKVGVTDRGRIVLYSDAALPSPAARVFFTLDYLGLGDRTSLLDGGLSAWRSEGRPVTKDLPTVIPGEFTPRPRQEIVVDAEWVRAPEQPGCAARRPILRLPQREKPGTAPRAGHIPGARNIRTASVLGEQAA
jgi:thiosulfate/3-mercaptopyruvate sulfurtransferase